jgi:putative ABC transport system permease protein
VELLLKDMRHAFRSLGQRKMFTAAAVVTIALGIGATSAIFSVVYGVLLRPLPYANPSELALVWIERPESAGQPGAVGAQSYLDWRQRNDVFTDMAAFRPRNSTVTLAQDAADERIRGASFTVNTLALLGVQPRMGRGFTEEEGKRGNENVILLGDNLWQTRFGRDAGILGRTIYVDQQPLTVVGVMPPGFEFPLGTQYWMPQAPEQFIMPWQGQGGRHIVIAALQVIGRLKPGVTITQAEQRMAALESQLNEGFPQGERMRTRLRAESLLETIVGKTRLILLVFAAAVTFVLLIACANVANLLLSRAAGREREIAVRAALGASRWRLMRHLMTESLQIALMGAALGTLLAYGGMKLLLALNPGNVPRVDHVRMDWPVLLFTLAAAMITGILFGLAPALVATRPDLNRSLKEGSGGAGGGHTHRGRIRIGLVLVETALAMVLLAGTGLLLKSFVRMANLDTGMDTKNVIAATVFPTGGRTMDMGGGTVATMMSEDTGQSLHDALERLAAIPGVESVAFASAMPPGGMRPTAPPIIEGKMTGTEANQEANIIDVSAGYFRTLRIPIRMGREFLPEEVAQKRNVVIVSETFAGRFLTGEPPVGKRFLLGDELWEIVGVAKDVRQSDLRTPPDAVIYRPRVAPMVSIGNRRMAGGVSLAVRTASDPGPQMAAVKTALDGMSGRMRVLRLSLLDTEVWKDLAQPKFYLAVISIFASVALLLSTVGIYGVLAYTVSQRLQEIGVRLALGAERKHILRLVIRQGMTPAVLGVVVGIGASLWLTRYLTAVLFEVEPNDAVNYVVVTAVLAAVALLACLVPARRAMRVDPIAALRYE